MTKCSTQAEFRFPHSQRISVRFDDEHLSQDAGLLLLRQVDKTQGLTKRFAAALHEWRDPQLVEHSLLDLVRARVFAIAQGYEDCNDAGELRTDPLMRAVCDRGASGAPLASQPSLSRFERRALPLEHVQAAQDVLVEHFIARCKGEGRRPHRLVLDLDSTDDPTHGQQPFASFNGHYGHYCYQQVFLFTAEGDLLWANLMSGTGNTRTVGLTGLKSVVHALRKAFPRLKILLRADNGFASPELYDWCEDHHVRYVVNCGTHAALCEKSAEFLTRAESLFEANNGTAPTQVFGEFQYQAKSWRTPRRVIAKAQRTLVGPDQRFIVTNDRRSPGDTYALYAGRGQMENWIKDMKSGLDAGKLSSTSYFANILRLLLFALAYQLIQELRRHAPVHLATARVSTIRLRLLRVAARVRLSARRLWVRLSSHLPSRDDWLVTARALGA